MKRVDHMIKYLSGELSPEESLSFERELNEYPQLKEEFSDVSLAYRTISDQLRSEDEKDFSAALLAAMKRTDMRKSTPETGRFDNPRFRLTFLLTLVAASVAILLAIFMSQRGPEKIVATWFHPSSDPVIMTLNGIMRGETGHQAIAELWEKEDYATCRIEAEKQLSKDESDQFALLFFLLSSLKTEQEPASLESMKNYQADPSHTLGQSVYWYKALALVRAGEPREAYALLLTLSELPGPYQKDAHKLKKKLRK